MRLTIREDWNPSRNRVQPRAWFGEVTLSFPPSLRQMGSWWSSRALRRSCQSSLPHLPRIHPTFSDGCCLSVSSRTVVTAQGQAPHCHHINKIAYRHTSFHLSSSHLVLLTCDLHTITTHDSSLTLSFCPIQQSLPYALRATTLISARLNITGSLERLETRSTLFVPGGINPQHC